MILLAVAAWLLIAGLVLSQCGPAGQTASTSMVATPTGVAFLPVVARGCPTCAPCATDTPTPEPPPVVTLEIYDCTGDITDTHWLTSTFGAVSWSEGSLAELRCSIGPSVLVAHVEEDGQPVEGATVVLHWADAPFLPVELQQCGVDRGVYGPTNAGGDIGFGLGPGSYYFPPSGGPHLMYVAGGGSCLSGLGMLGGTNHQHLDSGWVVASGQVESVGTDWGYSRGAVLQDMSIDGRRMWVIRVP